MKKLLILLMFPIASFGQTIKQDTINKYQYCQIQPLETLSGDATRLYAYVIFDDLKGFARFYYELRDEDSKILYKNNLEISGEAYEGWDANTPEGTYVTISENAINGKIHL